MSCVLAIDGMGGDQAPDVVIEGMSIALTRLTSLCFLLFGQDMLRQKLSAHPKLEKATSLILSQEDVSSTMKPSMAVRLKNSSMYLALKSVRDQQASGVVSAGNTGAYLVLSKLILKTLSGIDRPAIASQIPTKKGESVMLDLGANIECSARNIEEFALMGAVFAREVLNISTPRIGLLNVGSESIKGPDFIQKAAEEISKNQPGFYGFIEGTDLTKGLVDVIVSDGFSGNIALKTGEGVLTFIKDTLRSAISSSLLARLGVLLVRPALKTTKAMLDPRHYNGALWIGLNGVAVKSHGGSDALGFAHAIEMAVDMVRADVNGKIQAELSRLERQNPSSTPDDEKTP